MKHIRFFFFLMFLSIQSFADLDLLTTAVYLHEDRNTEQQNAYVLAGCISNTKIVLAFFKIHEGARSLVVEYETDALKVDNIYEHLKDVVDNFDREYSSGKVINACFALPGVMSGDIYKHSHLPWGTGTTDAYGQEEHGIVISKLIMAVKLDSRHVLVVNDFSAVAAGIDASDKSFFIELQKGDHVAKSPKLVTGPGVGFGNNLLVWDAKLEQYKPMQLQYSFVEFGAQSGLEAEYLDYLKKNAFNAWGKILGASSNASGIKLMYKFFRDRELSLANAHKQTGKVREIDDFDIDKIDFLEVFKKRHVSKYAADAVELFIDLFARAVRNELYAQAATGGAYITNSVVVENLDLFANQSFLQKILDIDQQGDDLGSRGYLSGYLRKIPVYIVANPKVQLYGAAMLCPLSDEQSK